MPQRPFQFGAQHEDGDKELHLKRTVGCGYLTPSNNQLFALTCSNHEVAYLRGRSIMHCVKLTAKSQETVDSVAVVDRLVAGFERALERNEKASLRASVMGCLQCLTGESDLVLVQGSSC